MRELIGRVDRVLSPRLIKVWVRDAFGSGTDAAGKPFPADEEREELIVMFEEMLDFAVKPHSSIDIQRWIRKGIGNIEIRAGEQVRGERRGKYDENRVRDGGSRDGWLLRRALRRPAERCAYCGKNEGHRGRLFAYGRKATPDPEWFDGLYCGIACFNAHNNRRRVRHGGSGHHEFVEDAA